ncbi:MAG TPA: glycosyltransferase family 4 protein [Verrucomicrobiae bacterium]|nr:glycosyltransferase family 4 protein [Verrucomicrobiae bacterium]
MLAILTTHPIQYQVPLWQALAADGCVNFEVWYLSDHGMRPGYDPGFGKVFSWDLNMLEGYPHRFVRVSGARDVGRFGLRLRDSMSSLVRSSGADALWINGWQVQAYWQAAWQAAAMGMPLWLRGESNDLATTPAWKRPFKRAALGQLFRRVNEFLCIGSANKRLYQSYGVDTNRLQWAPYAVDNKRFGNAVRALRAGRAEIRRAWAIPEDAWCVLFAGKLIDKKRPLDLVAALAKGAGGAGPKMHILFAGTGHLGASVRAACDVRFDAEDGQKTPRAVRSARPPASFAGFLNQTEMPRAYAAADCLVLPSDHAETWGLVVNEAMASGLPCVVSNACGCSEDLVRPVDARLVFPVGNIAGLAASLRHLASAPPNERVLLDQTERFSFTATVNVVKALRSKSSAVVRS